MKHEAVDTQIIGDIGCFLYRSVTHNFLPIIVLISGDGDYCNILNQYKDMKAIHHLITVIPGKRNSSKELQNCANTVMLFETIKKMAKHR